MPSCHREQIFDRPKDDGRRRLTLRLRAQSLSHSSASAIIVSSFWSELVSRSHAAQHCSQFGAGRPPISDAVRIADATLSWLKLCARGDLFDRRDCRLRGEFRTSRVRPALLRLASARAAFALARTRSASARAASVASAAIILATTTRFHASTSDLIEARCFSIEAALSLINLTVEHA